MGVGTSNLSGLSAEQVLHQIAEYLQSRNMTVQDAFQFLDQDRSGRISLQEFLRGVKFCLGDAHAPTVNDHTLTTVFRRFDVDGDDTLSIEEFAAAFAPMTGFHTNNSNLYYSTWGRQIPGAAVADAKLSQRDEDRKWRTVQSVIMRLASSLSRLGQSPQALFHNLDLDGNGFLSWEELERAVVALEPTLSQSEKQLVFAQFDKDGNQVVDLREFCDILGGVNAPAVLAVEDKVKTIIWKFKERGYSVNNIFQIFDRDGDGHLSFQEFQTAMNVLGSPVSQADLQSVFRTFDQSGDGFCSLAELLHFFRESIDRATPLTTLRAGERPVYRAPPVEAAWEREILDMIRSCLSPQRSTMDISEVFRRLDLSKSNALTFYEFGRMITTYRPDLSNGHVEQLFNKVNVSKTGAITYGEFVRRFG